MNQYAGVNGEIGVSLENILGPLTAVLSVLLCEVGGGVHDSIGVGLAVQNLPSIEERHRRFGLCG